mgnify:CR=1 FL=1
MAQKAKKDISEKTFAPAMTPEGRENQLIALAVDLAEQQLRDGTASSQVISHFLKLGSEKGRIEKEILEEQKKYLSAKTESINESKHVEELYSNAINAMRAYSGMGDYNDDEDL